MTENELSFYFDRNYKELKQIALKYLSGLYDVDIVMSNLYLHLYNFRNEIKDEEMMMAYSNKYTYGLHLWRQNRHYNLTEKGSIKMILSDDLRCYDLDEEYIDLEEEFNTILEEFKNRLNTEDKLLLGDYFDLKFTTTKEIHKFYKQNMKYSLNIKRRLDKILLELEEYAIKKINKE